MQERRRTPRRRSYIGATIVFNNRCSTIDCLIRDISDDGARLIFSDTVNAPEQFDLVINKMGETRRAQMAWRQADQAGVTFLRQSATDWAKLGHARRLGEVEAERTALRIRVAELLGRE
ncbi:PilZ domain-containing protein [Methylobacterium oxalidis]|uniref:PilZ domain-containing protein n=1 Tax=Methylobacterium oxalidis TaxID=944322 RepID=UPI003314D5D8